MTSTTGLAHASIMLVAALLALVPVPDASAQCTLVVRESFYPGPRPHGGNGRLRAAQVHDTLLGYWPQIPSDGTMWISSDQNGVPQWQFAGTSIDPSEVDPLDEFNGTGFADATAVALLPFTAPTIAFTTSANVVMLSGSTSTVCIGYTSGNALWNNFDTFGTLWMTLNGMGDWTIRANGNAIVAAGTAPIAGVMNSGWLHVEFTYDPLAHSVSGRVMDTPIPSTPVVLTRPLAYFAMENQVGWGVINNLSIYTGPGTNATASGTTIACVGATATFNVAASGDTHTYWRRADGQWFTDGPQTNGSVISGTTTSTLTITNAQPTNAAQYVCDVSTVCGLTTSNAVSLSVTACCPADLDNGSGTGIKDGGVDINDLLYFLVQFEGGALAADLDNGSGLGVPDGGVDISDLLYFLAHFEGGC